MRNGDAGDASSDIFQHQRSKAFLLGFQRKSPRVDVLPWGKDVHEDVTCVTFSGTPVAVRLLSRATFVTPNLNSLDHASAAGAASQNEAQPLQPVGEIVAVEFALHAGIGRPISVIKVQLGTRGTTRGASIAVVADKLRYLVRFHPPLTSNICTAATFGEGIVLDQTLQSREVPSVFRLPKGEFHATSFS